MNFLQRTSITVRLLLYQLVGLVLIVLAIGWFQLQTVRASLLEQVEVSGENVLQTMGTIMSRDTAAVLESDDIQLIVQQLLTEIPEIGRISVIDPTFHIIADTDPANVGQVTQQSALIEVIRDANELGFYYETGDERFYRVGQAIFDTPDAATRDRVLAAISIDMKVSPIDQLVIRDFTRIMLVVGGLILMYATFIFLLIRAQIATPLAELADVTDEMGEGNLDVPLPTAKREDEIGRLTRSFGKMLTQLRQTLTNLEQRRQALETSAEVSRRLSTILDPKQLATTVVDQLKTAFNYYHAHIYLLDEAGENLIMAGGTGAAGTEMLASGHKIPVGQGLVGRAAAMSTPILVPDVSQEEGWLPNPLLPNTKAETAVPIILGDQLLGVLDVQHNVINGLGQSDVELLESIASQVAIGLQNAALFEKTQRQANHEALINTISQKIENAATVESILDVAARELRHAFGAQRTIVELSANTSANGQ
jgi:putative methionine-R-sulfoxide reductase with GAF domain